MILAASDTDDGWCLQAKAGIEKRPCFKCFFVPSMAISVLALVSRFLMHELRQMRVDYPPLKHPHT